MEDPVGNEYDSGLQAVTGLDIRLPQGQRVSVAVPRRVHAQSLKQYQNAPFGL